MFSPRALERIRIILFFIVIGNFVAFLIGTIWVGGDALNGFVQDGQYYLRCWNKVNYIETTKSIWFFNRYHGLSMLSTHTLGLAILIAMDKKNHYPKTTIFLGAVIWMLVILALI